MALPALIFDVDGTLAETEEGHREAFNSVFAAHHIPWHWDREVYRELLRVTGGKERMLHYARQHDPERLPEIERRLAELHADKNARYGEWVRAHGGGLRPGVRELIAAAQSRGQPLAIVTTTSRSNIEALLEAAFGAEGKTKFSAIVCGEDVGAKKPDPEAYLIALDTLALESEDAIALEDSRNGMRAAIAAGLRTVITPSFYSAHENFAGAWRVFETLEVATREEPALLGG